MRSPCQLQLPVLKLKALLFHHPVQQKNYLTPRCVDLRPLDLLLGQPFEMDVAQNQSRQENQTKKE